MGVVLIRYFSWYVYCVICIVLFVYWNFGDLFIEYDNYCFSNREENLLMSRLVTFYILVIMMGVLVSRYSIEILDSDEYFIILYILFE